MIELKPSAEIEVGEWHFDLSDVIDESKLAKVLIEAVRETFSDDVFFFLDSGGEISVGLPISEDCYWTSTLNEAVTGFLGFHDRPQDREEIAQLAEVFRKQADRLQKAARKLKPWPKR